MKEFLVFCLEKKRPILFFTAVLAVFAAAFLLYRLPAAVFLYPAALSLLGGAAVLTVRFFKERERLLENRRQKELLLQTGNAEPELCGQMEQELWGLSLRLREEMQQAETRLNRDIREREDYYTLWAHQIKTPIAAMKLVLEGVDTEKARELRAELFRTEQYADMVMTYVKLEDGSSDFVFRRQAVMPLVSESIRRFSGEFILRKLKLHLEPLDYEFLTDSKWFSFLFEQLLSNALKYTPSGTITIYMKEPGLLQLTDTGIGIDAADLPRIFDKGFTGGNGREDKRASGIGLYLCRRVCERLGIGIMVASVPGEGTAVTLDLREKSVNAKD